MQNRWDDANTPELSDALDELVHLSNLVGQDPTLTQPGGGNSSVKRRARDFAGREVDALSVKGSGTDLRTITRAGFTNLRLDDLALLRGPSGGVPRDDMSDEEMMGFMRACMLDAREPAPSVETPLHAILPARFIIHTHDFATQALTDTRDPEARVREALGGDVAVAPYVRPGYPLARTVMELGSLGGARGLVLVKHGLVAWGDSARACYDNLRDLVDRAEAFLTRSRKRSILAETKVAPATPDERRARALSLLPILRGKLLARADRRPVVLCYDDSADALAFAGAARTAELAARGVATPEHVLRCGRVPAYVDADLAVASDAQAEQAIAAAVDRFAADAAAAFERHHPASEMLDPVPRVVLLPGLGLVTAMRDRKNALTGGICYRHVLRVIDAAEQIGGFRFLDEAAALEVEYWSLELAKLKQPERELAGQVALVTGAASGIGRAIAERFADEGAHLVLTDLDEGAVRATGSEIAARCRDPERVRALRADATSPAETAAAFEQAVLTYGGVDVLVANAGFVQAGAVDAIGVEAWERHFAVNVTGTFLAAREAARVMKAQRRGVILLNASKGAFAPTVDNSAYASSKAAAAAFARNLATELGPFSVRVNYFNADFVDTPLMRKLIGDRAALRGVSVEDQTAEYRRRNLLGVGPIPVAAVADAALFLVSARSRFTTGCALTIDGGIKEAMPR